VKQKVPWLQVPVHQVAEFFKATRYVEENLNGLSCWKLPRPQLKFVLEVPLGQRHDNIVCACPSVATTI
jgi:hypothetical protein